MFRKNYVQKLQKQNEHATRTHQYPYSYTICMGPLGASFFRLHTATATLMNRGRRYRATNQIPITAARRHFRTRHSVLWCDVQRRQINHIVPKGTTSEPNQSVQLNRGKWKKQHIIHINCLSKICPTLLEAEARGFFFASSLFSFRVLSRSRHTPA